MRGTGEWLEQPWVRRVVLALIVVALGKLLSLRQKFYEKAKDALAHEYKFNFATTDFASSRVVTPAHSG